MRSRHGRARASRPRPAARRAPMDPTHRFRVETPARLDVLVGRALDLSRTKAATLIAAGRVQVDGRPERASFIPAA
ncbi:MAG: S4 domain-containing protein, partial [Gemmatimonadota bacterium]|nr:S4 domain-containing protein [Gemmatimonadota bacterium]